LEDGLPGIGYVVRMIPIKKAMKTATYKGSHVALLRGLTITMGKLTTYKSWDDPPSCRKFRESAWPVAKEKSRFIVDPNFRVIPPEVWCVRYVFLRDPNLPKVCTAEV